MPHATVMAPSPGMQAVVLCGPGDSLNTFTSNPSDFPKALVPIANRPMLWYPLDWCYRMGITEIFLVTPPESAVAIESALTKNPHLKSLPGPRPTILAPATLTHTSSTGDIFRKPEVIKAITSDFVVLPCDLVSELDGAALLQSWFSLQAGQSHSATMEDVTSVEVTGSSPERADRRGGLGIWYPAKGIEDISVKNEETDLLGTSPLPAPVVPPKSSSLCPHIEKVVLSVPSAEIEDQLDDQTLPVRHTLLREHGRVKLKQTHKDAHVYFLGRWVLDMMQNDKLDTLSEDVIGWWAKAGWQAGLGDKLGLRHILSAPTTQTITDLDEDTLIKQKHSEIDLLGMSSTSSSQTSKADARHTSRTSPYSIPPMLAYIQPFSKATSYPLIHRTDTSAHLLNISLRLAKLASTTECTSKSIPASPYAHTHKVAVTSAKTIQPQSRISEADSLVADNVTIDSRVNVRESVIGSGSKIGAGSRLLRCLLMDNVVVGENVTLTGCTLGRGCVVLGGQASDKDKTRLTDCEIQNEYTVDSGTEAKGETFMQFDDLQEDESMITGSEGNAIESESD